MKPTTPRVRHIVAGMLLAAFSTAGRSAPMDTAGTAWVDGAAHPLLELTHVGALLVLGFAAALLGGRSRWALPLMTAVLMAFGIVLGTQGAVAPMLDTVIMTTALCLVLLVLGKVRLAFAIIASATGAFALFHGVADGFLLEVTRGNIAYLAGFAVANLALMAAGVAMGEWAHRRITAWYDHAHQDRERLHGLRLGS